MRTIELDEDVYDYIAKQTLVIGESASDILRRVLHVPDKVGAEKQVDGKNGAHELSEALSHPVFVGRATAVRRALYILSEIYKQKPKEFEKVLSFGGRERRYFGKSRDEISSTGRSTQPKKIPGSPYYVLTNSPTPAKIELVCDDVMRTLDYSAEAIAAVRAAMKKP